MVRVLAVSQLNKYLRTMLEADEIVQDVWVEGEIFDFRQPSSGHWYFKLCEGDATLPAVAWRTSAARIAMRPRNGDAVLAHGHISLYEASGALQLYIDMLQPAGVGLLHAQFEELKARLETEGLFDPSRKRPLPLFPLRIGVATSPSGAVIRDITQVLGRRYPLAQVILAPCRVQGDGAADTIVEALYALYQQQVDVIIVARGGGSAEDLWAFNEEVVARAVFASPVPVVSGVGHETDTTIIDYVADMRAPTPSAAAELVSPHISDMQAAMDDLRVRLVEQIADQIIAERDEVQQLERRLHAASPGTRIARDRQMLDELVRRAGNTVEHKLSLNRARLEGTSARLAALSPNATLQRGFAVVRNSRGAVITDPAQVAAGDTLQITVQGGTLPARAE